MSRGWRTSSSAQVVSCAAFLVGCVSAGASHTNPDAKASSRDASTHGVGSGHRLGGDAQQGAETANSAGESDAGDGGSDAPPSGPIPLDDLAQALVAADCERSERCDPIDYDHVPGGCLVSLLPDEEEVVARIRSGVQTGTMRYDPSLMGACLKAVRTSSCVDRGVLPKCLAAVDGTVPIAGTCNVSSDCEGDAFCTGICPGKCAAAGELSTPCTSEVDCAPGLYCGTDKACTAYALENEPCGNVGGQICALGLWCFDESSSSPGACGALRRVAAGSACDPFSGIACEAGAACVTVGSTTQICVERSAPGGLCHSGPQDSCPAGEICPLDHADQVAGNFSATCVPLPKIGQTCDQAPATLDCEVGANCSAAGICQQLRHLGETCESGDECFSTNCTNGECADVSSCQRCPASFAGGTVVEGFDAPQSIDPWDGQYHAVDPNADGPVSLSRDPNEGHSCPGALAAKLAFPAYDGGSILIENSVAFGPGKPRLDWTSGHWLHAWIKVADPGTGNLHGLTDVRLFVASSGDAGRFSWAETDTPASVYEDFDWHESLLPIDDGRTILDGIDSFGLDLNLNASQSDGGVGATPPTTLYLDDIWLE